MTFEYALGIVLGFATPEGMQALEKFVKHMREIYLSQGEK